MSGSPTDLPERLLDADATDFERRLLQAAGQEGPAPEVSARMAQALGVAAAGIGAVAVADKLAEDAAAVKATTTAGATVVWPWISAGVIALVAVGSVMGVRAWKASPSHPSQPSLSRPAVAVPVPAASAPRAPVESVPSPSAVSAHGSTDSPSDLRAQIALVDAARLALSSGAGRRALEILRRYQDQYPAGSFRPEAAALKVEVLVKLGRGAEARTLAERFVAEHPGSLLADRVAILAGLRKP
jgi:hypothetical protein